jgi:methylase of polypeptide subunit release factors
MTLTTINNLLALLKEKKREHVFTLATALMEWMQVEPVAKEKPPLLSPSTQKLMDYLVPAPFTVQPQLYRLSNDKQNIKVRLAVLKKLKKDYIYQLVDNDPGLTSFQASMRGIINLPDREPYIASEPYFIHFVTTGNYDRLLVIINQGEQKRIIQFKERLSNTQHNKILPLWENIGTKSKPEITDCIWKSLDVKEVNKDFYRHIKERFDAAVGIAKTQFKDAEEEELKQFAVRLIGRYIFCWFLKEKEIIPSKLLSSETIRRYQENYFQTYLYNLYFNTLNEEVKSRKPFNTGAELDSLFLNIPYLNGGLFDTHPEDVLFSKIDLNAWLINFAEVLESFDFTVDESSSQYQLVAIDPEMLGRIFENLLASQNQETEKLANQRKAFGAFYTPREIVDYMVNESLKAHVETHILPKNEKEDETLFQEPLVAYKGSLFAQLEPQQTQIRLTNTVDFDKERKRERLKIKIDKLFAPECNENPFDKIETQQVRKALSEIKILDPACGSGAFPMGVLLRLMELRHIIGHGHKNNYELKSEILSKNIYGVDIMPMAVEIARLRAWLSLVLEADYKPTDRKNNFGISALPNLDFKFVCANSLIDSGYDAFLKKYETQLVIPDSKLYLLNAEIAHLEKIRFEYFDTKGDQILKGKLKQNFFEHKDYIIQNFNVEEYELNEKTGKQKKIKSSTAENYGLKDFFSKVNDWNPFDDSRPSSFFSPAWMFGIDKGFDVVIGNPPYINLANIHDNLFREYLKLNYNVAKNKSDLYSFFFEKGNTILKNNGVLTFIVSNSWLGTDSFSLFRKYLLDNTQIRLLVKCHNDVFDASVTPIIVSFYNTKIVNNIISILEYRNEKFESKHSTSYSEIRKRVSLGFSLNNSSINLIGKNGILDDYVKFSLGIKTSNDKKFILNENIDTNCVKLIRGKDVAKYKINYQQKWIWYRPELMVKKKGAGVRNKNIFNVSKKIIIKDIAKDIQATIDYEKYFTNDTLNIIYECSSHIEMEFITGLLNSNLINKWFKENFEAGLHIKINQLGNIPITLPKSQKPFITRVEKILSLKRQNHETTSLEKEIDVLVYKLYELTYEDVIIIDKDFWLSKEEYEKVQVI